MKLFIKFLTIVNLLAIILLAGCNQAQNKKPDESRSSSTKSNIKKAALAFPASRNQYLDLIKGRSDMMTYYRTDTAILFNDVFISAKAFYKYQSDNNCAGIILSPGIINRNEVVMILAAADNINGEIRNPVILDRIYYPDSIFSYPHITINDLYRARQNYKDRILIDSLVQNSDSILFKKYRFIESADINELITQNMDSLGLNNSDELRIKIENCFVTKKLSEEITAMYGPMPGSSNGAISWMGWSAVMHMIGPDWRPIINLYKIPTQTDYRGLYLEHNLGCPDICNSNSPLN